MKGIKKLYLFLILLIFIITISAFLLTSGLLKGEHSNIEFYISPSGNDNNIGSINKPFKTLDGSINAITKSIKTGDLSKGNIIVYLRGGTYYRNRSLNLDKETFSNNKISITFKGYKNEIAIISGAAELSTNKFRNITDNAVLSSFIDRQASKNILQYDLKNDKIYFGNLSENITKAPELFFNNSPMTLSRWPNKDFANVDSVIYNPQKNEKKGFTFQINKKEPSLWNNSQDIWMFGYWYQDWYDTTVKVKSINKSNTTIESDSNPYYGIRNNQRFYFVNVLQELDTPGEYYIDRKNGILYFYPPATLDNSKIQLSEFSNIFVKVNDLSNITFQNITFDGSRGSGMTISNSTNIKIDNCIFRNLSGNAVTINGGKNCGVENSTIYNTGTGGIAITGGNRNTLTPANHYSYNNEIYNYARIKRSYSAAVNISGVGNRIQNNSIHDGPHTAILFAGNDNLIEYNEIYNVATETDDVGAIYSGRDWTYRGNIIRYNFLHNIDNPLGKYGKGGIYLDDCMSNAEIYGNVFYKVDNPLIIGGGRDITIQNNIIADCHKSISFDDRGITWMKLDELTSRLNKIPYSNSIWQKKYPELLQMVKEGNPGIPKDADIENNVLYNTSKESIAKSVTQYGVEKNNVMFNVNPGFTNIDKMDFSLKLNAPVYQIIRNFKTIPFNKIGLKK